MKRLASNENLGKLKLIIQTDLNPKQFFFHSYIHYKGNQPRILEILLKTKHEPTTPKMRQQRLIESYFDKNTNQAFKEKYKDSKRQKMQLSFTFVPQPSSLMFTVAFSTHLENQIHATRSPHTKVANR